MTTTDGRRAAAGRLHHRVVQTRGEQWLRFQGRSMAPTLRDGDLLSVRQVAADALAFGDLVVFAGAEVSVVHRLLRAPGMRPLLLTKGDNARRIDRPFAADRLLGKVCRVRRAGVQIDLERAWWRWASRAIAVLSLIEAAAGWLTVAVRERWYPDGVVRLGLERRFLRLLGRCRRLAIGALLRLVSFGEAR